MTLGYSPEAHRRKVRAQLAQLVTDGGPGWHDYALKEAERLEKEDDSLHGGLHAYVKAEIRRTTQPKEKA